MWTLSTNGQKSENSSSQPCVTLKWICMTAAFHVTHSSLVWWAPVGALHAIHLEHDKKILLAQMRSRQRLLSARRGLDNAQVSMCKRVKTRYTSHLNLRKLSHCFSSMCMSGFFSHSSLNQWASITDYHLHFPVSIASFQHLTLKIYITRQEICLLVVFILGPWYVAATAWNRSALFQRFCCLAAAAITVKSGDVLLHSIIAVSPIKPSLADCKTASMRFWIMEASLISPFCRHKACSRFNASNICCVDCPYLTSPDTLTSTAVSCSTLASVESAAPIAPIAPTCCLTKCT